MAEAGDIRRFRTPGALKAYAGYHVLPDGTVPRPRRGELLSRNGYLHQAVWQFTRQLDFLGADDAPWRQKLDTRLEYERGKFPDMGKGHLRAKARRYVGQKFLEHVWSAWGAVERLTV